ncbi:sorting nexin-15 [Bombina bombina]|uniref:sorting nexin-15 n=1 Tax=Bombina bombina TaxID=8345 RepID=UPI00235ADE9A|nr:sorting nexin-15 [Bombina bombina]
MSRGTRDQYERRYHVTDSRTNPKGFTEYMVTAVFISKKNPQDVKEVVVWKRYSDFKKLHGELSYTHRNLFQRTQEFPAFPRAQVFGRFEPPVIEERRQAAEQLLKFTVGIPALNNSPQLKEFFREGDVILQSDTPDSRDILVLPVPLTPEPARSSSFEIKEDITTELQAALDALEVPEYVEDTVSDDPSQFDLLFDMSEENNQEEEALTRNPLTSNDLALFDPCYTEEHSSVESGAALDLLSLGCEEEEQISHFPQEAEGLGYLSQATEEVHRAMAMESAANYPEAFKLYRNAVDTLLRGVKDEHCTARRDAVTRKTAEYLRHAERIFQEHMSENTT